MMPRLFVGIVLVASSLSMNGAGKLSPVCAAQAAERVRVAAPQVDVRAEVARGFQEHDAGRYQSAASIFLGLAPQYPVVRALAARSLMEDGDLNNAYRQAVQAVREADGAAVTHFVLGLVAMRSDRPEEAMEEYQRTLALDPSNAAAHNNAGGLYYRHEDFARARMEIEEALRLSTDTRGTTIALSNLAELDELNGEFALAEEKLNQTLDASPEDSVPYFGLAALYDLTGREEAALRMEKYALALDPYGVIRRSSNFVWSELKLHAEALEAEARGDEAVAIERWTALRTVEETAALKWMPLKGRAAAHLARLAPVKAAVVPASERARPFLSLSAVR